VIAQAGSRRIGIGVAAAAGALLVLGGCAAGQHAQTADVVPVVDGVAANAGSIALRAVTVAAPAASGYAKGSNATLQLVIVNSSLGNDQLIGISTPVAADARMFADEAASTFTPPPTPTDTTSTTPTDTTSSDAHRHDQRDAHLDPDRHDGHHSNLDADRHDQRDAHRDRGSDALGHRPAGRTCDLDRLYAPNCRSSS